MVRVVPSVLYPVEGGDKILLTCTTDIDNPESYEWYKNDTKVVSASGQSLDIGNSASSDGEYKCNVVNGTDKSAHSAGEMISFKSMYLSIFLDTWSAR